MTISISALLTFSVAGIIIFGFAICFFATGRSDQAALRLKYARKSVFYTIFTEKNYDKITLEIFYLHFEFYCVRNDL